MRFCLLACVLCAGCLRQTQFQCENDTSCGAGGKCESTGFCSVIDTDCTSGRRYGDSAGSHAGQCTDGMNSMIDSGVDSSLIDGRMIDGMQAACPADFMQVSGAGTHVYKVITLADNWAKQQMACQQLSTSAYLLVPDNQAELDALDAYAATTLYWIGVNDIAVEGTFVNVLNMPQMFLPWQPPAPDDAGPGEDCVESLATLHKFNDDRCNTALPAVCECGN